MNIKLSAALFSILLASMLLTARFARAESLPDYNIEGETVGSEAIVVASPTEGDNLTIEHVWSGELKAGQTLQVERFSKLSKNKFDSSHHAFQWMRGYDWTDRNNPVPIPLPPAITGRVWLFLEQSKGQWKLSGGDCGVKWIVDNQVLGYKQVDNGGYFLLPDAEARTETELQTLVESALAKKAELERAQSLPNINERVAALAPFVGPKQDSYFNAALESLRQAGAIAVPVLLQQADVPLQNLYRRQQLLKAFAQTHSPDVVPYMLALAEVSAPKVKAQKPLGNPAQPLVNWRRPDDEARARDDWATSIDTLAHSDVSDERVLAAFRDALLWSAPHCVTDYNLELYAAQGLQRLPHASNLPIIEQALASIPEPENRAYAVKPLLEALETHRYPAAVPILAGELNFPADVKEQSGEKERNAQLAHRLLIAVVGSDLGTEKAPWLAWWKEHSQHLPNQ